MRLFNPTHFMLADAELYMRLAYACAGLLVLILIMAIVVHILKGKLGDKPSSTPDIGFTLKDLRDMHARGQLTKEELDRAVARVAERSRQEAMKPPTPAKPPGTTAR